MKVKEVLMGAAYGALMAAAAFALVFMIAIIVRLALVAPVTGLPQ